MKLSSLCLFAIWSLVMLVTTPSFAGEVKKSEPAIEAAMMPSLDLTPKQELVKFVSCSDEMDCYRALQESDVDLTQTGKSGDGVSLVAEFVDGPKKGVKIFKRKN